MLELVGSSQLVSLALGLAVIPQTAKVKTCHPIHYRLVFLNLKKVIKCLLIFVNPKLVNVGVMLLIFGFVGFNAASQLSITQPGDGFIVVNSTFNTFLACSAGGIVATLLTKILPHFKFQWSYANLVNGALSGMVNIFGRLTGIF